MGNDKVKARETILDNRTIRVFISSTFQDMKDERTELIRKTFPERPDAKV